ncbi:hypothetical protein SAMN06295888_10173 [Desulfonatronum zhilinae]|nr:hypothetical protein SAMN06295888_10173 [Desulfonatronum zhilinae]
MDSDKQSLGRQMMRTIVGDRLVDIISDVAEVSADSMLSDGIIKELPIFGTLVNLKRAGLAIRDEIFIQKLIRFLQGIGQISDKERKYLLEKYPDDSIDQQYLGENLLLTLDRLDNMVKPVILAKFFSAYIKSEIDYTLFSRLSKALEVFNISLLPALKKYYFSEMLSNLKIELHEEIIHEMSLSGLITISLRDSGTIAGNAMYVQTRLGREFLRIGFDIT